MDCEVISQEVLQMKWKKKTAYKNLVIFIDFTLWYGGWIKVLNWIMLNIPLWRCGYS